MAMEGQLRELRFYSHHLSVRALIRKIMTMTDYDRLAAAMPGGRVRRGNLEQLEQKAEDYAKTSYRGLFNFIRYIEHLQKYEVKQMEIFPAIDIINGNVVRLTEGDYNRMTVYGSRMPTTICE